MCYIKNPGLKPAVFTTKNFTKQTTDLTVDAGFQNNGLPNQATAPGGVFQNLADGFQIVGKRGRQVGSSTGTVLQTANAPTAVSNSFHSLTQDEVGLDGKNLESGNKDTCLLDKDPIAIIHNSNSILVDVIILEGGSNDFVIPSQDIPSSSAVFSPDPPVFAKPGRLGKDPAFSKTRIMDAKSDCSSEYFEGSDNYKYDFSNFSKDDALLDQSLSDHSVADFKLVGTEIIPFRDKRKKMATYAKKGKKKTLKNAHETSNILDKRTRSGFIHNDYVCANVSNHIWLFSDTDTKIQILKNSEQILHVEVSCISIPCVYYLTVVYGRNTKIQRRDLWDDLLSVSQNQVPWMVGGDFNIILQPEEKKGGAGPIQSDMDEFNDCLLNCNLHDGGFTGTPFTWYRAGVWQRSDHNSLFCNFNQSISTPKAAFRFQNMWVKHHLFLPTVKESWDIYSNSRGMLKLVDKLSRLKYTLKEWNKFQFGNIFTKIDRAEYEVEVAENVFDQNPCPTNLIHLNKINANLTLLLSMEEDFWKQKANMKWMVEGERNSKFFHSIVRKKRQNFFLHRIRDRGNLISDPEEIKFSAIKYFSECFADPNPFLEDVDPTLIPNIINNDQNKMLCANPTFDEIKNCIFQMNGDSVAGPDGFGIKIFQVCWDIIAWDVFDAVLDFFSGSTMPRAFTTTTISLIPKNNNPQSWKDFRPISLCNTTYKIISKILAKRLGNILPSFINPAQSGFIKGRNITDNILTAHEVTHDISQSVTNTIIKLDMEKAYDRLNWNFIIQVLTKFGFSNVWINFIKACISNCWFSILVNGQSVGFFKSERGVRQGDPLSPLIFAIAADYFSRSIDNMFEKNPAMFYKIKKKVKITHLGYADDILIFLNASGKNLHIFNNCITHYECVSGQKINTYKINFIMHKPTPAVVNWVQRISGFNKADLPIMYLGVPLWKGFQSFDMYGSLISKIKNKILNWNHHLLSTGDRLELIKLVLNSVAFFNLQVLKPPENVIIAIERLFNKFLWGTNDNRRRLHWAAWSRLCYPTDEGGLGCRDLHDIIRASEIKMWWRFRTSDNIWSNFLMKKYCSRLHPMIIKLNPKSSHIWKNLCDIRSIANPEIFWHSGNGNVSFWHDSWCDMSPLNNFLNNKSKDTTQTFWTNG
ncbi:hypothetical protein OROMI_014670 [Orobanche minor]